MKRVLIVECQPLMRRAIMRLVTSAWPKASVVEAGDMDAAYAACRGGSEVSLVVLDPALPDVSGLSALVAMQQRLPETPIVVFTARQDDQIVASSNALGAMGYVHKSADDEEVISVLRAAGAGTRSFPPLKGGTRASEDLSALRKRLLSLTTTQMKVLLRTADGSLNKQVAADLSVSEAAIKAHLTAVFRKLGVQNRTQAMLALQPVLAEQTLMAA